MRSPEYERYLQSPEWRAIRERRLAFDRWQCRNCHAHQRLQIHHWYYTRDQQSILGHEQLEDVVTLCDQCHWVLTQRRQAVFGTGLSQHSGGHVGCIVWLMVAMMILVVYLGVFFGK